MIEISPFFLLIYLYIKAILINEIRLLYYGELITGDNGFMVNPISKDYYKLASYAAAANINHNDQADLQSQLVLTGGVMLAPSAYNMTKAAVWDAPKWAWQNRGNYTSAWNQIKAENAAAKKSVEHLKGKNIFGTINNRANWNELQALEQRVAKPEFNQEAYNKLNNVSKNWKNKLTYSFTGDKAGSTENARKIIEQAKAKNTRKQAKMRLKNRYALKKSSYYDEARRLIEEAKTKKLTGKELKAQVKLIEESIAKADLAVHKAIASGEIKAVSKSGKAWAGVKKYSGYNAIDGAMTKGATSSSKVVRGIAKGAKGGGLATAAIGLACETPDIIETYKKGGAGKGTKQLAKSTGIAAAEGIGFAVGAKVGAIAGAKIGATIGTCIGGPVGTAVGGVVGALVGVGCGILGSWLAGKGARALAGKSELQKINEEEAKKLAENAQKSKEGKDELLAKAEERASLEGCTDEEVLAAYEKIVKDKKSVDTKETSKTKKSSGSASDKSTVSSDYQNIYNLLSGLANYKMSIYPVNTTYTNNILTPSFNNTFNPYYGAYNNMFNANMMYNNPFMQNMNFGLYA